MDWITARLREDNTRAALSQIGLVVVLIAIAFGVDIGSLLDRAESAMTRIGALGGGALVLWANWRRIIKPDPASAPAVAGELLQLEPIVAPGLAEEVAGKVLEQLKPHLPGGPTA